MVSYFYCQRGLFYVIVFLSSGGVYFLVFLLDFCIFLFLCVGWLCLDCGFVRYQGVVSVNGKGLHGGEESVTTGVVLTAIDPYFFRLSSRRVCETYVSNCAEASRAHQGG